MNLSRRTILRASSLLLLLLLFVMPFWIVYRTECQAQLDYRLIQAIKADDPTAILAMLHAGANGNARDLDKPPVSLYGTLLRLIDRYMPRKPQPDPVYHPTALLLLLTPHVSPESDPFFYGEYSELPNPPQENITIVKMLLANGADISERDDEQKTPIMLALEFRWMETVRLLVEAGASPNIQDTEGEPPLTYADAEVASTLVRHGADVNARDAGGRTPLMKALCPPNVHADSVPILLAHGANVHASDDFGTTPLLLATLFTDASTMKLLLDHGADANQGELAGQTPLIAAVECKDLNKVKLLLEHGAKTTSRDETGLTALAWAQKIHDPQIVALLAQAVLRP